MSRTDAHRPYWVKYNDPTIRDEYRDHHDHTKGFCDLDLYLNVPLWGSLSFTRFMCHRWPSGRRHWCSCRRCDGNGWQTRAVRKQRVAWRAIERDAVKTAPADRDELDGWVRPTKTLW